ncbi:MAG: type IX secretion system sortase PorU [Crocinitomicaceae bacterium]|nr:type IX secretion system sortase PorU [Crocinitomicaceae bacterium]
MIEKPLYWYDLAPVSGDASAPDHKLFRDEAASGVSDGAPVFVYRQRLSHFSAVRGYRIIAEEVTSFPMNLLKSGQDLQIESDWKLTARVTDGGGVPYLVVALLPIREKNGVLERLVSFSIEITIDSHASSGQQRTLTFAENSVLKEGTWYKIAIARDGIYKIDRSFLSQLGIDVTTLNPQQINVYGNGGSLLPEDNMAFRYDDLQKNAIFVQSTGGNTFGSNDYILFYGKGPDTWGLEYNNSIGRKRWIHTKHYYSDSAYYFIRIDDTDPLRVSPQPLSQSPETHLSSSFQDYQYIESDQYNLAQSGREFYGDLFDISVNSSYSFNFPNISTISPASIDFSAASRSIGQPSSFTYTVPGTSQTLSINSVGTSATSLTAQAGKSTSSFIPSGANVTVGVTYNKANADAKGWLDYITINATRNLVMNSNQMRFADTLSAGSGNITQYQLGSATTVSQIWDITDFLHPGSVAFTMNGGAAEWKIGTDIPHEFIAFTNGGFLTPTPKGKVENQNLHALQNIDLVIVSAPLNIETAVAIKDIHTGEGMQVALVTPEQVFNEFSGGNPDVTAIRTFMKMFYDRAGGNTSLLPENLLLLGDGDYLNNKGMKAQTGSNVIVFESDNSLSPIASYVSDDYFVFLSDDDNSNSSLNALDCGVGRIPASSREEAAHYLSKLRAYIAPNPSPDGSAHSLGANDDNPFGSWRNVLTFVADDQDGNGGPFEDEHLSNSDALSSTIHSAHPEYDIAKIYMDAYTQITTPGGERYPEGEEKIRQRIQNGALLVTYIGHGGERGWAHERILDIPTIQGFTNKSRLPVFLTATCELARYDNPGYNSAGEILLMNPSGGAIAMLTTTRIVFSGENYEMDQAFFDVALEDETISNLTLGKINQLTKNGVSAGNDSKPNFSLLGDPALRMVYPRYNVYTTAINGIDISQYTDTMKSLQEVEIKGYIGDLNGNKLNSFNGFVYPTVYDKETKIFTQNNDGGIVQEFSVFNKNIYRGKVSVSGGDFVFRFVVPYDINYSVDNGRISYYAVAGSTDAHGYEQDFLIGSSLSGTTLNTVGPELNVYMNDSTFVDGGVTNTKPLLIVRLSDENGINTVGNGIGHDIIATLDNNAQNPIVLNDFYEADLDTYKSGSVRYQLSGLSAGNHTLKIKAWDVHNNSSEKMIEFTVADNASIVLEHLLNYPNPFTTHTDFFFEHNQLYETLDVKIQVFTVSGKLVKTITRQLATTGFRSEPISWDGTDDFGDRIGKGVYVYKIAVKNSLGQKAEQYEKLVILK